ncbi:rhamnogalacturonan acetylesterase [Polaribacter sp.]|uniref:rhamnogalacturonan acetylesterase n=1 Tax=Polaribacter sp. TaxID=1920175 RepID=UPI003F6A9AEA
MKYFKIIIAVCLISIISCKEKEVKEQKSEIKNITIHTIGDSTMANKPKPDENPERGWCQVFPKFLNDNVTLENHAVNGRSTRSFIDEKKWEKVHNKLKEGDYVFIQFGHNDQKENSPKRYTNPYTAYRNNLIRFVKESREKGAKPILFTSIVRRNFNADSTLVDTHGVYPLQVRLVANEYEVPLIDLQYLTEKLEESYGYEGSKKLHLHYAPNEIPYYPKGKEDDTHLSVLGATEVAKLAVKNLKEKVISFDKILK